MNRRTKREGTRRAAIALRELACDCDDDTAAVFRILADELDRRTGLRITVPPPDPDQGELW